MLWYKAWRESQGRYFLSAAAIASVCLTRVLFESRFYPGVARDAPGVTNYLQYIFWTVFGGGARGVMQLSCLLLGLGGLQRDRKLGTIGFTLALPVSRLRLVLARAGVGAAQILTLAALAPLVVWAASPIVHQHLSFGYCFGFFPLWVLGGLVTFGVTFVCSVVFPGEYTALAVGYLFYMFLLAGARHPSLRRYPLHVADFMSGRLGRMLDPHTAVWTGHVPIWIMAGYACAAIALLMASALVTTRQDF